MDRETGRYRIPLDALDAELYFIVDKLKPGQISEVVEWVTPGGRKAVRIVWLMKRYPPHRASLELDYDRFAEAALQKVAGTGSSQRAHRSARRALSGGPQKLDPPYGVKPYLCGTCDGAFFWF